MQGMIINEENTGLPPGAAVYVGDTPALKMNISFISYSSSFAERGSVSAIDELSRCKNNGIMWISVNGLKDIDSIKQLAKMFGIHSLTVEDILNTEQQPKTETFENYRFISFKSIRYEKKTILPQDDRKRFFKLSRKKKEVQPHYTEDLVIDQISIVFTENLVITFQEREEDPFDGIRKRILENIGLLRSSGTDYLAYALIDAVVDKYYLVLAHIEDSIEEFEDRAVQPKDDSFITEIQEAKKFLYRVRRVLLPLRDNLMNIYRRNPSMPTPKLTPFLQDLHENINNAIDTVDTYREWLSNITEVNLTSLDYQLNKVMKVLTIISSIFIPLTFIAGIYGMNFQNMPELSISWAYPAVLILMLIIAIGMIIYMKLHHW